MNPYWNAHFFQFFYVLFSRLVTGKIMEVAPDEVQIATLSLIALACGIIGPFLVLKRLAMFANSLSHTILVGIAAAFLCTATLWGGQLYDLTTLFLGALIAALLTAFFTEGLVRFFRLQEDASIGLVFTALFALGILIVTLYARNAHLGVEIVMGNADALQLADLRLSALLALVNAAAIFLFYRHFACVSFDASFAKALGLSCRSLHFLLLFLAAITILGAFRAVGIFLVLGLLIGPYLTARLFCHRLRALLFWTPSIGILACLIGVALARHLLSAHGLALSTGGLVVCIIGIFYFLARHLKRIMVFSWA